MLPSLQSTTRQHAPPTFSTSSGDFLPFWEFVAGPINAGTFGPAELDLTFGPEIRYQSVTAGMKQNLPPTEGKQYFGAVRIEGATEVMTVSLHDVKGDTLFRVSLDPEA